MARKQREEAGMPMVPAWLGTYGDMITLVLCFFVLLYGMSSMDSSKAAAIVAGLTGQSVSVLPQNPTGFSELIGNGVMDLPTVSQIREKTREAGEQDKEVANPAAEMQAIASDFKTYFAENELETVVQVEARDTYVSLVLADNILFDSGRADLRSDSARDVLQKIAELLSEYPDYQIKIEGHADSQPISTAEFENNWFLSSARAIRVAEYFIDTLEYDPMRIEASGFSFYRPVDTNLTPEGRANNRRVEFKITPARSEDMPDPEVVGADEGTDAGTDTGTGADTGTGLGTDTDTNTDVITDTLETGSE